MNPNTQPLTDQQEDQITRMMAHTYWFELREKDAKCRICARRLQKNYIGLPINERMIRHFARHQRTHQPRTDWHEEHGYDGATCTVCQGPLTRDNCCCGHQLPNGIMTGACINCCPDHRPEPQPQEETCEHCDTPTSAPNFAYHFCTGRKTQPVVLTITSLQTGDRFELTAEDLMESDRRDAEYWRTDQTALAQELAQHERTCKCPSCEGQPEEPQEIKLYKDGQAYTLWLTRDGHMTIEAKGKPLNWTTNLIDLLNAP